MKVKAPQWSLRKIGNQQMVIAKVIAKGIAKPIQLFPTFWDLESRPPFLPSNLFPCFPSLPPFLFPCFLPYFLAFLLSSWFLASFLACFLPFLFPCVVPCFLLSFLASLFPYWLPCVFHFLPSFLPSFLKWFNNIVADSSPFHSSVDWIDTIIYIDYTVCNTNKRGSKRKQKGKCLEIVIVFERDRSLFRGFNQIPTSIFHVHSTKFIIMWYPYIEPFWTKRQYGMIALPGEFACTQSKIGFRNLFLTTELVWRGERWSSNLIPIFEVIRLVTFFGSSRASKQSTQETMRHFCLWLRKRLVHVDRIHARLGSQQTVVIQELNVLTTSKGRPSVWSEQNQLPLAVVTTISLRTNTNPLSPPTIQRSSIAGLRGEPKCDVKKSYVQKRSNITYTNAAIKQLHICWCMLQTTVCTTIGQHKETSDWL